MRQIRGRARGRRAHRPPISGVPTRIIVPGRRRVMGKIRVDPKPVPLLSPELKGMHFAHPEWLWLLGVVPLLALWSAWGAKRRMRDWSALGQVGRPPGEGAACWLGAIAFLVVAL